MGAIQDAYNLGDFINLNMQELVKDYILSLKEGHSRTYTAIGSIETITSDHETRITSLETGQSVADRAKIVSVDVAQIAHGLSHLDPVYFNGSSFVRAGGALASADGIVKKLDDNNFTLIIKGSMLLPVTRNDDLGNPFEAGQWYFLSDTVGEHKKDKPITGIFQPTFRVYTDSDTVKHCLIDLGNPVKLSVTPKLSLTDGVGYNTAGTFDWIVPDYVYKVKITCAGGGGGGGAYSIAPTDGGPSVVYRNGGEVCNATGGKKGIMDHQNVNAPAHGMGNGGDLNVKGGGSHGGIGVHREHRGDNDNVGSDGTNGGLAIKYLTVVPQDTIRCVVGAGGAGGMENGDSDNGIPDLYSQAGSDGYIFIEY